MKFTELVKARYSVRSYKDTPIEPHILREIIEAGRVAPTARNFQPQRVFIASSDKSRETLASICRFTFGAPVVLVIGYDKDRCWRNKLDGGAESGETDAAIVTTHMMLAAAEAGLGSCWVGYFSPDEVRDALGLPENIKVTALLPLGYPADDATPAPFHEELRPLEETVTEI